MKNILLKLLIFILFVSGNLCISQISNNKEFMSDMNNIISFNLVNKNIVGSVYIEDKFVPARLSIDSKIYSVRYDAYQDEIEIQKNEKSFYLKKNN